jgi:colanic acid biosynthesis glycosyl transferase WcaI
MRVLILAQYFPPDLGGSATRAYNIAKGLQQNGCEVEVVTAFPHYPDGNIPKRYRHSLMKIESFDGIRVIRTFVPALPSKRILTRVILFSSFIMSSLFAILLVRKADVIWAANPDVLVFIPASFYSRVNKCKIVLNVDDLWPEQLYELKLINESSFVSRMGELLARRAYSGSAAITPISPGNVSVIVEKYGVQRDRVKVVRGGVNPQIFQPNRKERANERFKVLYSGNFSLAYDFDQVLNAAKSLDGTAPVEFVFQGKGEQAKLIKSRAEEYGLKNVTIMNFVLERSGVAKLLNEADALILPLRKLDAPYLGLSSKIYEFQAVGKPIICCADGPTAEYVKQTNSGIVVNPGDSKAIANAVLQLSGDPDLARTLGASGRRNVEEGSSIDKIGAEMTVLLRQIVNSR